MKSNIKSQYNYRKSLKEENKLQFNKYIVINKYINRPLASLLVRVVYNTNITPNQISVFSFVLGVIGAIFFISGKYYGFVLGGVFVQLSSIVDCADGMLARARGVCCEYGAYLDIFLDRLNEFIILIGISIGLYLSLNNFSLLVISGLTVCLYFLQITLYYITKAYLKNETSGETSEFRALLLFLIFLLGTVNLLHVGMYILFCGSLIVIIYLIFNCVKLRKTSNE